MNINKIWSILGQGELYTGPSARKMNPALYSPNIDFIEVFEILFGGLDSLEIQFYIEQYVQLVFKSIIKDTALDFDPINTYSKTVLQYAPVGFVSNADDFGLVVYWYEGPDPANYLLVAEIDGTVLTISFNGGDTQTFTYVNNLSSVITLPNNDTIRIGGELSPLTLPMTLQNYIPLQVDWEKRFSLLNTKRLPWTDPDLKNIYTNEINWVDRLSAVILQAAIANNK